MTTVQDYQLLFATQAPLDAYQPSVHFYPPNASMNEVGVLRQRLEALNFKLAPTKSITVGEYFELACIEHALLRNEYSVQRLASAQKLAEVFKPDAVLEEIVHVSDE